MEDFSAYSEDELRKIVDSGGSWRPNVVRVQQHPQPTPKKPDDYGFTDRRHDEITAQGGRDAYAGQEYVEGLAPFARSVRESGEREEDENQSAFLNGKALEDAIERHGDAPDESLKGYKAQQFGAVETGVRMAGHNLSKAAANLPLFIGEAVKGVRGLGRRAYNNKATDVLIDYARDAGFDDEEIERAKEHSQGDPYKMYDFFQELAEATIVHHADQKAGAAQRLAEHADEEGLASKIAGGALGMIPMMEEFAIGGGIVKGLGLAKGAANAATWQGRLAAGLQHSKFMTPLMGSEFARRRYGELTRDEYVRDEDGNLVVKKGDNKASALAKATAGGLGEAAIFSLPIGEAVMGWAPKVVTKALRTKVSPTVAKMYENYVKYGQLTGLRGQPVMLGLMDANTFKDEVLGWGKKSGDYEGFGKEWDKFWNETMSVKNQADLFVSTLGVMAVQGGVALAKARSAIAKENRSTDAVLKTYFEVPDELLRQMSPEHKSMWRKIIMDRSKGRGFTLNEENLRKFVGKMGDRYGEATRALYDKMAKYALEKDNSRDWMKGVEASEETSFSVPKRRNAKTGNVEVAWDDDIEDVGGRTIRTQSFTDPKTGITVSKFLPTDAGLSDDGYVYVVRDRNGRQATRRGITDAIDAARDMERAGNTAVRQRQNKANYIKELYAKNFPGESPEILDTADQYQERYGRALLPGQIARNADGKQVYILDRIETPQMAMKTVLHEVGRHRGLDFAIPDANARAEFLRSLAASDDPVIQDRLAHIAISQGFTSPEEALKDPYVVEEVYAHLFDHEGVPAEPGAWEKHGTAIRRTMRRFFKRLPFSREEAEEVYRGAMDELSKQTGGAVSYIPEEAEAAPLTPRQEHEQRMERKAAGAKAVGEYRAEEAAARLEEEARKSAMDEAARKAEEERLAGRKSAVESAVAEAGEEIGAERERRAREHAITRKAQEEKARIKAEAEEYEAKERERIERERRAEQEAQEDAELERMIAEETRENERKALEDYRKSRREAIERRNKALAEAEAEQKRLDAERERIAQERARASQEREEARRAGYESADEKARQERQRAISDAFHRDASIRGKEERDRRRREAAEFEAAEEMRKLQETAEEADIRAKMERGEYDPNAEPPVFVEDMPKGKTSLKHPGDVVRTVWQGKNKSNPIIVRAERDADGNLMGWNVLSAEQGKPERLIRSVPYARNSASSKKQTAGEAIKASANALKKFFGDPNKPVDELAKRVDEKIAPEQKSVQPETVENRGETGAVDESAAQSGNLVQAETPRRELFDGRNRSDATAINDIVSSIDWTGERAERRANGDTEVKSVGDALDFLRNFDPNARFFDKSEELMDADRAESNRQFVNMIGALHDERRIRGFGDFARLVKSSNPELFKNRKGDLRAIWNYAAHISDGKIEPIGEYAARDAIRSADEGRNVRDVTNMNALRAALQEIDVEMYPARKINGGDARNPNIKLAADPKSGIIPGHELPGTPRSLLSKPILAIEYADGEMHVGTGRHRRDLYDRFDMDIPIRRLKETDGWVKKREDGTYDTSKIRLLDALDNIQDNKGSIEDYVSFFRDVQIPREEAEREGFLGSKEARVAYALANDASPDLRASVNFEGGKRKGFITPEQAGAIADIAPLRGWEHNDAVQRQLLKDVLADRTMDTTDIQIDAAEIAHDIRREIEAGKIVQGDLFGGALDAGADIREKKRDYIRSQIAEYERLAKDIRAAKNSDNGLTIKREDMRKLGINERNVAKGGVDMRREYEAAAQRAMMRAMEWRQMELKPEDRAQMERALGIETDAQAAAKAETQTPDAPKVEPKVALAAARRLGLLAYGSDAQLRKSLALAKEHGHDQVAKDIETIIADRKAKANLPPREDMESIGHAKKGVQAYGVDDIEAIEDGGGFGDAPKPKTVKVSKGQISMQDAYDLFNALNSNKETGELMDKVFNVMKDADIRLAIRHLEENSRETKRERGETWSRVLGVEFGGNIELDLAYMNSSNAAQFKANTMLHEMIHAATDYAISLVDGKGRKPKDVVVSKELRDAVKDLHKIYDTVKDDFSKDYFLEYASQNVHEFIAELSNQSVRDALKKRNLWTRVVDAIRRVLRAFGGGAQESNAYEISEDVLDRFLSNFDREAFDAWRDSPDKSIDPNVPRGDLYANETRTAKMSVDGMDVRETARRLRERGASRFFDKNEELGAKVDWGDENREVKVVGGGVSPWQYKKGVKTKEAKTEIYELAQKNVAAQPNYVLDEASGNNALMLDGVKYRITKRGLFHGADRRLKNIGPAIAKIGDVLNASVEVPVDAKPWRYRIAATDFGKREYTLITSREVDGAQDVVDVQTLYSINVKSGDAARTVTSTNADRQSVGGGAARELNHTDANRPNTDIVANLKGAWQGLFEKNLAEHIAERRRRAAADNAVEKRLRTSDGNEQFFDKTEERDEEKKPSPIDRAMTRGERFRERWQDSDVVVRNVQDEIGGVEDKIDASGHTAAKTTFKKDGTVDALGSTDVYNAKDRENGYLEAGMRDIQSRTDKIDKVLATNGITPEQFDRYLYAAHAEERNRTVAERNGREYDPASGEGSGLSEIEAKKILSSPEVQRKRTAYEVAAKMLYDMNDANLRRRLESGRISQELYDLLTKQWKRYVPLRTDVENGENAAFNLSTAGFRSSEFMTAEGRKEGNMADSPYAFARLQAEQGVRGSERNIVNTTFANLVRQSIAQGKPIGEITEGRDEGRGIGWTFHFADGDRVQVGGSGKLAENRQDIVLFKEDGKLKAIRVNPGAEGRGLALAQAVTGENVKRWAKELAWLPKATRWLSAMRTQYSPEFIFTNSLADHLEAAQALVGRYGIGSGTALAAKAAMWEAKNLKFLRAYINGGAPTGYVKEAIDGGLLIKGGVASQGFAGEVEAIKSNYDRFVRDAKKLYRMNPKELGGFVWDGMKDLVSHANELVENSTRIGIYSALRERGVSVNEAVKFARDATVNFNRRGTMMPWFNGLYMFANASVQGAVRSFQAMGDRHGAQLVSLLVAAGVAKAVLDHYFGNDDEREKAGGRNARNVSEYEKKHILGIPVGGGKQIAALRMRGPYAAIPYLAQTFTNVALGETEAEDAMHTVFREITDQATDLVSGNGVVNDKGELDAALVGQTLAPSLADPLVQLWTGKDYKGDWRTAKSYDQNKPLSSNGKRNTAEAYKTAAQSLNWLTGGNENRKGMIDVAPEDLQLVVEFLGGGIGRDIHNVAATTKNVAQIAAGETPERTLSQTPLLRTLLREYPESTARYYDAIDEYSRDKYEIKKARTAKEIMAVAKGKPYLSRSKTPLDERIERVKELMHLERGERKIRNRWVKVESVSDAQRETYRKMRLKLQAAILKALRK